MDRAKHRRLIVPGVVLLAGGAWLLLSRQWSLESEPIAPPPQAAAVQSPQPAPDRAEPVSRVEAPAPGAMPAASAHATIATGFHGRVIDAVTRRAVQTFEITLTRLLLEKHSEDVGPSRTFTSATGRFAFDDLAAGTFRATVSAPGYQPFIVDTFESSPGKATRELVMPLQSGFAVRGRVLELSTGAGIADAYISAWSANDTDNVYRRATTARSKEDGSFTLDGIPGGDVTLRVGAQQHAFRDLQLVVDEKTPPQEIVLYTGGTIAGRVQATTGAPAKGRVVLEGPASFVKETDEAGRFSYSHVEAGQYRVWADTPAGSATLDLVLGQNERKDDLVLIVGAGRSVRGIVRGLRPEQLSKTYVMLRSRSGRGFFNARVDEHGAYAANGVPAGKALMMAIAPGRHFEKTVDIPADQDVTFDIVFPAGAHLSGRVTQGGNPAVGKSVWARRTDRESETQYRTTTSADGQYEIEGLPSGEYRLRADDDISRAVTIAGDTVLNIEIPSVQLSAHVLEDGGAVPIVGAKVYLRGIDSTTARVWNDKQTDDFGEFRLTGIEPGGLFLMVYKQGYELHREKIAYSTPITNRKITLRKSAGVEVRVQPGSRRFPEGFTLTLYVEGSEYEVDLWMPLDRDGVCHVPSALAGTTLHIGRFSGEPILIPDWDGRSFELP